jgi:hypothetical protein
MKKARCREADEGTGDFVMSIEGELSDLVDSADF